VNEKLPSTIDHVAFVEVIRGPDADPAAPCDLLVEVPHGADRRHHYDELRARLVGDLPEHLEEFFSVNTDVGAWAYGRATAERVVASHPERAALLVRCLVPRTFVDCNRPADFEGGRLDEGALTAGVPSYVRDDRDRELLLGLHRRYVELVEDAYAQVCGSGGVALVPHTYGPRSMGIAAVDDDIVKNLRWACEPERELTWPLRAEVDLLTRTGDGELLGPPGAEEALLESFTREGFAPVANDTFYLHPASLGHRWCSEYPGQVLCLEVRRDLLVDKWTPLEEMVPLREEAERVASVLAPVLVDALETQRD
jgi:hypothetical protein